MEKFSDIRPLKRASLFTLGCRLNQYETEALRDRLEARGYEIVPWGVPAGRSKR